VLLNADYVVIFCTEICWYRTRIFAVIWRCIKGPVFWDSVYYCYSCYCAIQSAVWSSYVAFLPWLNNCL